MDELEIIAYSLIFENLIQDDIKKDLKPTIDFVKTEEGFKIILKNCKLKKSMDKIVDEVIDMWQLQHISDVEIISRRTERTN